MLCPLAMCVGVSPEGCRAVLSVIRHCKRVFAVVLPLPSFRLPGKFSVFDFVVVASALMAMTVLLCVLQRVTTFLA